jgi:hypothetical protein
MTEAKRRALKLDRNLSDLWPIVPSSTGKNIVHHLLANEERQKFMQDHPLVMPRGKPAGSAIRFVRFLSTVLRGDQLYLIFCDQVDGVIVKE